MPIVIIMAATSFLPFQSVCDEELYTLINSDSVNYNYRTVNILDKIIFSLPSTEQDDHMNDRCDPLILYPDNTICKYSQYL